MVTFRYLQEYSALGTAGGIYHFRDQIMTGNPDMIVVMNADVCGDFPLQDMLEFHNDLPPTAVCTMLATEVTFFRARLHNFLYCTMKFYCCLMMSTAK